MALVILKQIQIAYRRAINTKEMLIMINENVIVKYNDQERAFATSQLKPQIIIAKELQEAAAIGLIIARVSLFIIVYNYATLEH